MCLCGTTAHMCGEWVCVGVVSLRTCGSGYVFVWYHSLVAGDVDEFNGLPMLLEVVIEPVRQFGKGFHNHKHSCSLLDELG